ncbi:MAG: DNA repair protein RecO [Chitinispirillaceae bacterium]|nr:DNA repair protein RecO [Chitinispirillaceae bacterium]
MSIEKCNSIILATMPYRESSILMYLFTRKHGRIHGLAKGIRTSDRRGVPVERGYLIEHMIYFKPHRDLHQVTDCHIREHYPAIRGNLEKTAVRDVLFDLMLGGIKDTDPHPELFDYLRRYLSHLDETACEGSVLLLSLSKILFGLAGHLGFGIDFGRCVACGKGFGETIAVRLTIDRGMLRCRDCPPAQAKTDRLLPGSAAAYFARPEASQSREIPRLTDKESSALLHCACDYCRHHLEIHRRLESLSFIEHLFAASPQPGNGGGDDS